MSIRLDQLQACFEGVFPALIATTADDGTPNVSYLSHVAMVDAQHIALTNQFFGRTADNLRAFPHASILVLDGLAGLQYTMQAELTSTLSAGPEFDRLAARVLASGARVGLAGVMRLRSVDVFRVGAISVAPSTGAVAPREAPAVPASLAAVQRVIEEMARQTDVDGLVDATLAGLEAELGMGHTLFMVLEEGRGMLSAIGSRGYAQAGIGSDVALGEGVIGAAASSGLPVRINDLSRTGRFSAAVAAGAGEENVSRRIALPGLTDPLSQIAVPIPVHGAIYGVLFAECRQRLAFSSDHEVALSIIARQAGAALALIDKLALEETPTVAAPRAGPHSAAPIEVIYYQYDDSVFINGGYVIKGIAGRLLHHMLEQCLATGRLEFSNREIRLDAQLRLPALKDNLETRLLLLRRRLDERGFPIRVERLERGRLCLRFDGELSLAIGGEPASKKSAGQADDPLS
jgi:adenylate cyclase